MPDTVGLYLTDIGAVPLLNAEDEVELAKAIETGREAREFLAVLNQEDIDPDERTIILGELSLRYSTPDIAGFSDEQQIDHIVDGIRLASTEIDEEFILQSLSKEVCDGITARERFIESNLRLVVSIARRYPVSTGIALLDHIQEGNQGLEHAVDKFDWRKGFKFSTYATWWIRQAIKKGIVQKKDLIRLPEKKQEMLNDAMKQVKKDNCDPEEMGDTVVLGYYRLTTPTSLNKPVGDDEKASLEDLLSSGETCDPANIIVNEATRSAIWDLLKMLNHDERLAIDARFGFAEEVCKSYKEIGQMLGLSEYKAKKLIDGAIAKMSTKAEHYL